MQRLDRVPVAAVNAMPAARANRKPAFVLDTPTARLRRQRKVEHIHALGSRVLYE